MVKGKICGQYVNSVIAKRDAIAAGYDEAIMLDVNGYVSECTGENLFMVKNQKIVTPGFGSSILGGITRDSVIQVAHDMGVALEERTITRDELYTADEIFLCGTAAEITPVREIDGRRIGSGRKGEITSMISGTYFDIVKGSSAAHPSGATPFRQHNTWHTLCNLSRGFPHMPGVDRATIYGFCPRSRKPSRSHHRPSAQHA